MTNIDRRRSDRRTGSKRIVGLRVKYFQWLDRSLTENVRWRGLPLSAFRETYVEFRGSLG